MNMEWPYISNKDKNGNELSKSISNSDVTSSFLLTPKDKIVSIRVYKHKFDKNDKRHFLDIRDDTNKIQNDNDDEDLRVLNDLNTNVPTNMIIYYSSNYTNR